MENIGISNEMIQSLDEKKKNKKEKKKRKKSQIVNDKEAWKEERDQETNQTFWYNDKTGVSTWENPFLWKEAIDPESNNKYWYNDFGESTWDNPYEILSLSNIKETETDKLDDQVDIIDDQVDIIDDQIEIIDSHQNEISEKSMQLREAAKQRRRARENVNQNDNLDIVNQSDNQNIDNQSDNQNIVNQNDNQNVVNQNDNQNKNTTELINNSEMNDSITLKEITTTSQFSPTPPSQPSNSNKYENSQRFISEFSPNQIDAYVEKVLLIADHKELNFLKSTYENELNESKETKLKSEKESKSHIPIYKKLISSNTNDQKNSPNSKSPSSPTSLTKSIDSTLNPNSKGISRKMIVNESTSTEIRLVSKYVPIVTKANMAIINEIRKEKEKEIELEKLKTLRIARGRQYAQKVKEELASKRTHIIRHDKVGVLNYPISPYTYPSFKFQSNSNELKESSSIKKKKKIQQDKKIDNNHDSIFTKPVRILKIGDKKILNTVDNLENPIYGSAWIGDCLAKDPYEEKLFRYYENEISKIFYDNDLSS